MPVYAVFTHEETHDPEEMSAYSAAVGKTFDPYPAKIIAAYGVQDVLEGPAPEGVAIVEFPTMADARAWYDSPEYQAIVRHRWRGSTYRAVIVQGQ